MNNRLSIRLFILILLLFLLCPFSVFAESSDVVELFLSGSLSLLVPEEGHLDYSYTVYYLHADGSVSEAGDASFDVSSLPSGVVFNVNTAVATVYDNAVEGDRFVLTVYPGEKDHRVSLKSYTVEISDNLLSNGDFREFPEMAGWDLKNSSPFSLVGSELTFHSGENAFSDHFLTRSDTVSLRADTLYELSFEYRTPEADSFGETDISMYTPGFAAVVYVTNPSSSDWTSVRVPLHPEQDGNYLISLVFSYDGRVTPVSVRSVTLRRSLPAPSSIAAFLPQTVNLPRRESLRVPISLTVLDQEGHPSSAALSFHLSPESPHITVTDTEIIVERGAAAGLYTITAQAVKYPSVSAVFSLTLTDSGIAGGDFELENSADSWIAAGNGDYHLVRGDNNTYAVFTPNADIGVLYNNAYVSFKKNESYVFSADLRQKFSDAQAYITFILEDSADPENLVLCAYFDLTNEWKNYKATFTPEIDLEGRFIVAVNVPDGFDEQAVYMDNIASYPALIMAENVRIYGTAVRGSIMTGQFDFVNNFDGESASITNWALADTIDGPYKTLSYSNVAEIELTEDMEGKYLRFEVTPLSLTAGIIGDTVYSVPVLVQSKPTSSRVHPSRGNSSANNPPPPIRHDTPDFLNPLKPSSLQDMTKPFGDMHDHWAERSVSLLASAGVVSGYSDGTFDPERYVTRAEFCAFLMRSMQMDDGIYGGRFSDVAPQSWYAGIIQTMDNCALIHGTDSSSFSPNAPITREQIITILMRTYGLLTDDTATHEVPAFADAESIAPYARPSVGSACFLGILQGDGQNLLPASPATRAEAVTLLFRLLEVLEKTH